MCSDLYIMEEHPNFSATIRSRSVIQSKEWTAEQQVQEFKRRFDIFLEAVETGKPFWAKFKPCSTDVLCVVPPKSGTTWVTHICHQIRTQGSEPTFKNQTEVVTWVEWSELVDGIELSNVTQPGDLRIFVTNNSNFEMINARTNNIKMIYVFRDQADTLYSIYRMLDSVLVLKGRVASCVVANEMIERGFLRNWLEDLVSWWERRHQKNILFLFYDDLKEDHAGCVRRIAHFLNVDCNGEVLARVVHTTTHKEMSKISFRFDHVTNSPKLKIAEKIGEAPITFGKEGYVGRVRNDGGRSGDGRRVLSSDILDYVSQVWRDVVTAKLGFENLQEMRQTWTKELHA